MRQGGAASPVPPPPVPVPSSHPGNNNNGNKNHQPTRNKAVWGRNELRGEKPIIYYHHQSMSALSPAAAALNKVAMCRSFSRH